METITALSTTISVINGTFTLGQWFYRIRGVPDDVKVAVAQLASIQADLNYARQLRSRKFDMSSHERKTNPTYCRVERAIKELETTLKECSRTLQAANTDRETRGGVTIASRFDWVLNGKDTFDGRKSFLVIDHSRLMNVLNGLEVLPDASPSPELLAPPPYSTAASDSGDYWESLSPSQRRTMRGKSTEILEEDDNVVNAAPQG